MAIIGLGAWAFVHLLRAHGRLLLRVEHLEQQLVHAGLADALGDLTGEAEGLPPGSPVPVMTADDIEGGPLGRISSTARARCCSCSRARNARRVVSCGRR